MLFGMAARYLQWSGRLESREEIDFCGDFNSAGTCPQLLSSLTQNRTVSISMSRPSRRHFVASLAGFVGFTGVTGVTKKYKGVPTRMIALRTEMKALRAECDRRARAKAAAAT